jgi:hypothetical protein
MKYPLLTVLIVSFGMSDISIASPLCDKLKMSASQLTAFRPLDAHGKYTQSSMNEAVTCLNANWDKLSKRLEFRGLVTDSGFVVPVVSPTPSVAVRYSPAAMYNANAATPSAFLSRPVTDVNYLPVSAGTSMHVMTQTYRLNAPHLMDEVPTANYQGSLATPITYQTGHWNVDR